MRSFSPRLLGWFDAHGRRDLPWQQRPNPYRVWVSEIMLQQTRVTTVIPYFQRFIEAFPDVAALAQGPLDQVLHLWSGLGYYARARNLHAAARIIHQQYNGCLPEDLDTLQTLPGIGRSTAAAILSLALGQHHAILDGNCKRVLARYHGVAGWPGNSAVLRELWQWAEQHTPAVHTAAFNQAMMDLGATLCSRSRPQCGCCPLQQDCVARATEAQSEYPAPRPRRALPVRATAMLLIRDPQARILLDQRPPTGLWGGLWALPECPPGQDPQYWCRDHLGLAVRTPAPWPSIRHTFSHFHLDITPVLLEIEGNPNAVQDRPDRLWYDPAHPPVLGLAAPVSRLLQRVGGV